MKCGISGCPGKCEERKIAHTIRRNGQLVVIDHVPAEVCCECGDVLLRPETIRHIEALLRASAKPVGSAPLYEYC